MEKFSNMATLGAAPGPRVLFVDQTAQLGGAELSLLDLVRRRHGSHDVLLFEEGPLSELLRASAIDVAILPIGPKVAAMRKGDGFLRKLSAARSVASSVRGLRGILAGYDVIYANTPKAFVLSALASGGSRRPLVYHLRDILSPDHFSPGNRRILVRLANRRADRVIANSQATAEAFVAAGGDRSRVVVIPNGIDVAPFRLALDDRQAIRLRVRQQLGFNEGAQLLALVGRLAEWKGQHVAIEALRSLPGAELLLVGEALFGEQEYVRRLHHQAESLGVADRVHFLGFRHDVAAIMQGADVLIHTSIAPEPFGRVLVEGMLSQCPVIATRGGGVAEIVADGETGLLVDGGSAESLAGAAGLLFDNPRRARELADKAYRVAMDRFRIEPIVDRIDAVIAEAGASVDPILG